MLLKKKFRSSEVVSDASRRALSCFHQPSSSVHSELKPKEKGREGENETNKSLNELLKTWPLGVHCNYYDVILLCYARYIRVFVPLAFIPGAA